MRKVIDDPRLMVRVCDLYYNQGISQQQIAKDLNLSRPTVSRVLALAKEQGIVKISISNVNAVEHWELERRLEKEFGLREVIIVGENSSEDGMKESLGSLLPILKQIRCIFQKAPVPCQKRGISLAMQKCCRLEASFFQREHRLVLLQ